MKSNLINVKIRKNILTIFSISIAIMFSMLLFPQIAQAKMKIVFFCTDWNAKCRDARKALNADVAKYPGQLEYKEFNVDSNETPDQTRLLGLSMPDKIPFIVLLDKNGNILYQSSYSPSAITKLEEVIDKNVK